MAKGAPICFVLSVYKVTKELPSFEVYGLTSQFRRAAVSVSANIAEGFGKTGKADKVRYLNIAQGSLEEARYYAILSKDLQYADTTEQKLLLEEVSKMLNAYRKSIQNSDY